MAGRVSTTFEVVEGESETLVNVSADRDGDGTIDAVAVVGVVDGSSSGGSSSGGGSDSSSSAIDVAGTVVFIDYDGTVVAQYTTERAQSLTALPDLPDHSADPYVALTGGQWNWTLAEVQGIEDGSGAVIGACYETPDNGVYLLFEVSSLSERNVPHVCIFVDTTEADAGSTIIDWGDGTSQTVYAAETEAVYYDHTYTAEGTYLVSILGGAVSLGHYRDGVLLPETKRSDVKQYRAAGVYALKKAWLGSNLIGLHGCAFAQCHALESVSFSPTMVRSDVYYVSATSGDLYFGFYYTTLLEGIVFPKGFFATSGKFATDVFASSAVRYVSLPAITPTQFYASAYMFNYAANLKAFCYPKTVQGYGAYGDTTGGTQYGSQFFGATSLEAIYLYQASTVAFTSMVVPAAFVRGTTKLRTLELPSNISEGLIVGSQAFYECAAIDPTIFTEILNSVKSFDASFSYSCYGLSGFEWVIPATFSTTVVTCSFDTVPWLKKLSFEGSPGFTKLSLVNCPYLKEVDLAAATSIVYISAFTNLDMPTWEIPYFVTTIGGYSMRGDYSSISIGDSENGSNLATITAGAFYSSSYLPYLENLYIYATTPPTLANVSGVAAITDNGGMIHVPSSAVEAYKAATNWATYADDIVGDL